MLLIVHFVLGMLMVSSQPILVSLSVAMVKKKKKPNKPNKQKTQNNNNNKNWPKEKATRGRKGFI